MTLPLSESRIWLMTLVVCVSGALMPLAYTPFAYSYVALPCLAMLFLVLQRTTSPCMASWMGFIFGFSQFAVGLSWIHISIDNFGGLPLPVSLLLMLLLCSYLSLYPALAGWIWYRLGSEKPAWLSALLFPAIWLLSEYLRGTLLTGFPWLAIGYSQVYSPLFSWAPFFGVQGIAWWTLISAVCLSQLIDIKQLKWALPTLLVVAAATYFASQQQQVNATGKTAKVALVQGNISQIIKWDPEQQWPTMSQYQDMSRPYYGYDLIIWPEAAIPAVELATQDFLYNLDAAVSWQGSALITGIIDYRPDSQQYFNDLIVLGRQNPDEERGQYYYNHPNRYSKHHLVPIGEFVPFQQLLRPLAPLFNLPMSSFSRGDYIQPNLVANGWTITPAICFEILFPEQVRLNTHEDTDFILTVSNDGWFGDSIGPHQHLEIAQMRAKELGRPVLRDTNNGITAVIDADGSIQKRLPQFEQAVLATEVSQYRGITRFAYWGHWPVVICCGLSLLLGLLWRRKKPAAANEEQPPTV